MFQLLINPVYLWLILALLLVIVEIFTLSFVLLCFALASLATSIASSFGAGLYVQLSVFSISALLSLVLIRPFAKKILFNTKKNTKKLGTDAFIGQSYKLLETLDNEAGSGRVKIGSEIWKTRSIENERINSGELVTVDYIEGTTLYVNPKKLEDNNKI